MFARQRATHFDHSTHQAFADRFDPFQFSRLARVEQKIRMQIAISRVEDVDRRNTDGIRFVVNQLQQLGQRTLGNNRVLNDDVGAELSHQSAGDLTSFPELFSLLFVVTKIHLQRAGIFQQLRDRVDSGIHQHRRAFDFRDKQERIRGQANRHRAVFDHRHESRIHQFDCDGK